jgi:DNA-binding NarL/FixJ family response regulator
MARSLESDPEIVTWLVEDNDVFRRATVSLLERTTGISCPMAVPTVEEALAAMDRLEPPDIVLMDIGLPGMSGIEGARLIAARSPSTRVVMLTVHEEDEKIFQAICAGASGYLLKPTSADGVVAALREVYGGAAPINSHIASRVLEMFSRLAVPRTDYGLSAREKEILELMAEGLTLKQIAARLIVSFHTIDTHTRNIYAKLHVHSRSGAVAKALKERLI